MTHTRTLHALIAGTIMLSPALTAMAGENSLPTVSEQDRARHETTGVVSGAVIGGLLGGPIGAFVTAAFGSWVGDQTLNAKENALLSQALEQKDHHQQCIATACNRAVSCNRLFILLADFG